MSKNNSVYVIHGRNFEARRQLHIFLRSIGLNPLEWNQAVQSTNNPSPYNMEILNQIFSNVQSVIVLLTPDDWACLNENFIQDSDAVYERELTGQARPNVLFEAGMAFASYPRRTVIVELGELRPFSNISGINVIRLNNSIGKRQDLAQRIINAGCKVDLSGKDWHTTGDFVTSINTKRRKPKIPKTGKTVNINSLEGLVEIKGLPKTQSDRVLLFSYWLFKNGASQFGANEVLDCHTKLRIKEPSNIWRIFNRLKDYGLLVDAPAEENMARYQISMDGEKYIENKDFHENN